MLARFGRACLPVCLGGAVAFAANIPLRFFESTLLRRIPPRPRRLLGIALAFGSLAAAAALAVRSILPELAACAGLLAARLPGALTELALRIGEQFPLTDWLTGLLPAASGDATSAVSRALAWLIAGLGGAMNAAAALVRTAASLTVTLALAAVFAAYLLADKERLGRQARRLVRLYLGEGTERRAASALDALSDAFRGFLVGQCAEAFILGSLCMLGMMIFRFPYAMMIGALVGFTALIPVAGAFAAAAAGAFMIFTAAPEKTVWFLVFFLTLQQFEGNVIFPRVVGSSIGLPPLGVLTAVTLGGGCLGVPGMALAVPLAAALRRLLARDADSREAAQSVDSRPTSPFP